MLSYGYDEDMENIARALPKGVQTVMMSATLSAELDALKGIFCRNPTLLDLKEEFGAEDEKLTQFYVKYVAGGAGLFGFWGLVLLTMGQVRRGRQVAGFLPHLQALADQGTVSDLCRRH